MDHNCQNDSNKSSIVVATSIAPRNIDIQKQAIYSWLSLGFDVVSLNCKEEIDTLNGLFPGVRFVESVRDGRHLFGRPYVFLDELLLLLSRMNGRCVGIVNSDIIFKGPREFYDFLEINTQDAVVFGSRVDVDTTKDDIGSFYERGFDFFFMNSDSITDFPNSIACIGVTWWDYWLPLIWLLRGNRLKYLATPFAYHVRHPYRWSKEQWEQLAEMVRDYLLEKRKNSICYTDELRIIDNFENVLLKNSKRFLKIPILPKKSRARIAYRYTNRFGLSVLSFILQASEVLEYPS